MEEHYGKIVLAIVSAIIGVIAYYLKKRDAKIDSNEASIKEIEKDYLTRQELKEIGLEDIKKDYVTRKELEKVEEKLENRINENNCQVMEKLEKLDEKLSNMNRDHIDKEEFVRYNVRVESKIDKIQDMVLEVRKGQDNGQR